MITVHHLEHSRSQRVLWLLEELGLDYEIVRYARDPKTSLAPPELTEVHPLGKSPVITDGDVTVAESGAILEYVIGRYGEGRLKPPEGTEAHRRYVYWMHYAEGSLMPLLVTKLIFNRVETAPMPFFVKPVAKQISKTVKDMYLDPNLERHLAFLEQELGRSEWFAGDELTGADIQMSFPVEGAAARGGLGSARPRLRAFLDRVHERPAYRRALERGGPLEILG
ncbi:MAG: glutathione S-transferase [Myxococcota bacterium]